MTARTYKRAIQIFSELRELPKSEWPAAVASACSGDTEVGDEVMRLLDAEQRMGNEGGFLDGPAIEEAAQLLRAQLVELQDVETLAGRYRLGTQIGAGGMGVVYEAEDLRLGRRVALKILPGAMARDQERYRRFQREAWAASQLNDPHIVSIYDAGTEGELSFIAMELVEGRTLRQMIASGPPPDTETALGVIEQTASALATAHEAGIIHRDIKPENIMVRPDGLVKILDFGLARTNAPPDGDRRQTLLTRPGQVAGTMQYLSPEQVLGKPLNPQCDLFSLGVVAYEYATGVRPFDGVSEGVVLDAILHLTPPKPSALRPGIGGEVDALVMKALEKDLRLRFHTAIEVRNACKGITPDDDNKSLDDAVPIGDERSSEPGGLAVAGPDSSSTPPARWKRPVLLVAVTSLLATAAAALFWLMPPAPSPRVTRIEQITGGGPTNRFVIDGARLVYAAGNLDADMKMFAMSVKGGDPVVVPQLTGMIPFDISQDHSEMLLGQIARDTTFNWGPYPVWVADTSGNPPRRMGDLIANEARWSPKGDQIVYSAGRELRIARSDGSESRTIAVTNGRVAEPAWSPDGRFIRFDLWANNTSAIWEVTPEGRHLHLVFPELADYSLHQGSWAPDGKTFFFVGMKNEAADLWAVRERGRFFGMHAPRPVRVTTGPIKVGLPKADPGGRRIFFEGQQGTGELVRYDPAAHQWTPYLGGMPAMQLDYSRDGKWVTYSHSPEGTVFRSTVDGSERMQLTAPPFSAMSPRWSPDGTQITYFGHAPREVSHIYIIPAGGGPARQLTHGEGGSIKEEECSWSSDGASIVFGATFAAQSNGPLERRVLEIVDVKSRAIAKLPGTEGLYLPRWSPDGRYIAAVGFPDRLWLYNLKTQRAIKLTNEAVGWPSWSRDSQYVYFKKGIDVDWSRIRIQGGAIERVASLTGMLLSGSSYGWVGLTPDGTAITLRDRGGREIYALDWDAP